MENSGFASSFPMDNNRVDHPLPSQWLETTLSEFNDKMTAMLTILEEDDSPFSGDPEKRLELVQMLQHLNRCYRSLAEEHEQMMLKLYQVTNRGSTSSSSYSNSHKKEHERSSDAEFESDVADFKHHMVNQLISDEPCKMISKMKHEIEEYTAELENGDFSNEQHDSLQATWGDFQEGACERENSWSELKLQVSKLMQENLVHQAELARRNVKKNVEISRLRLQLKHLKAENSALQQCISSCLNGKEKHSQVPITKIRGPILGKFFGGCS